METKKTKIFDEIRQIRQKMYEMWRDDPVKYYEEEKKNTEEFKKKYIKKKKAKKVA